MLKVETSRNSIALGLAHSACAGGQITVEIRDNVGVCSIAICHGADKEMSNRLVAHGVAIPDGPRVACGFGISLIGTGPGAWIAFGAKPYGLASELQGLLGTACALTDQTDGLVLLRLVGRPLRDVLSRGIAIDLDDSVFRPYDAATTVVADCGVTLWRLPDRASGELVFEIAVASSYFFSFWHWLEASVARFGFAAISTSSETKSSHQSPAVQETKLMASRGSAAQPD